ncbi:preprotein translocase subunit SecD [Chitinivorax tropicus]|uniref:Protein translocase subunit SecD n=1 Tax=Chitinivorax tropicus TaxID=714531 RepID=A0A840MNQ8_9PROT|nr:protein translocase subunit SecD [Chitinivorax tropicus]MBB5020278.1 preprotein translocase subunit SecD [Chitinivorax tropicus]
MNRYPVWKYVIIALALIIGTLYTIPNFYGDSPAVQISPERQSTKIDSTTLKQIEKALADAHVPMDGALLDGSSIKVKVKDQNAQYQARDIIQKSLGGAYIVALNSVSKTPDWMTRLHARPMFLGLDLRGGVHFLLQIDMQAAMDKAMERYSADIRRDLRDKKIRYGQIRRIGNNIEVKFRDVEELRAARAAIEKDLPTLLVKTQEDGDIKLVAAVKPEELKRVQTDSVKQNITTLHNRVNELGVAEPIIQQQGEDRIVVQLPGVQDTAKAKDILGRTASLEVRLVEDDSSKLQDAQAGNVPVGYELLDEVSPSGMPSKILVKKDVELTGDNINDAQPGFSENGEAAVHINLDSKGAAIFKQLTRDNIGRRMAMILVEKGKAEVVTAPVIRTEIGGGRVQISGSMNTAEANDTALLLRSGALAAPMTIVEERTVGPSLGKENIEKGFKSTLYGFVAIMLFMLVYYRMMGFIATFALGVNLFLLISVLSMLQATLTLPGIAAIALTLGMAIDANVLINERIREEVRNGVSPQAAIKAGYEHAWATILDSNVTTLIAGVALLIFGSGAVRGFAVVHCLGILTSMFSAVFVARGMTNLIYGYRRRLQSVSV